MANNMKKILEDQQKINSTASVLIDHFKQSFSLSDHYERMAKTQALMMMTMGINKSDGNIELPVEVAFFFDDIRILFEMLTPFDEMAHED